jgi:hypothetical protein
MRGGDQRADQKVLLPPHDATLARTNFTVKSNKTHDDLVNIICSLSGRVYYLDFETEPPNEYYFTAYNEPKGLEIQIKIFDSEFFDRIIVEIKRLSGGNLAFLNFF